MEAIAGLLSQPVTTLRGRYVRLTEARCEPKPVQQPHPPITIGGRGRTRTLRTAARWAQQWNVIPDSPEQWAALKAVLAGHCAAIGRDVNEITCSVNVRIGPDGNLEPMLAAAAAYRDAGVDLLIVILPYHARPGFLQTLAEALGPLASRTHQPRGGSARTATPSGGVTSPGGRVSAWLGAGRGTGWMPSAGAGRSASDWPKYSLISWRCWARSSLKCLSTFSSPMASAVRYKSLS